MNIFNCVNCPRKWKSDCMLCDENICIRCHERFIRRDMSCLEREQMLDLMEAK